jgi:hypothetical protein
MSRLPDIPLDFLPGIMTEETDRGAKGRYKDCDKIRFRHRLPEKLGGWVLNSLGTEIDGIDENASQRPTATAGYSSGVATIASLSSAVTCLDADPVWLFDDSVTGGLGTRTIDDPTALQDEFTFDLDAAVTADAGDAFLIRYPEEFGGGASVTGGGVIDSETIMVSIAVTSYLREGTIVRLLTDSGEQLNTLAANHSTGATVLTLTDPLIDNIQVGTPNVFLYAAMSAIRDDAESLVVRFLNLAVAAATEVMLTESLPEDADGLDIDIRPFQLTFCDGDQTGVTSLDIAPVTDFAIGAPAAYPDGLVILPAENEVLICYKGNARALWDWDSLDSQKWLAIGTHLKLYLVNNNELFDITPFREVGTLIDPFDTNIDGLFDPDGGDDPTFVQVTDTAHGNAVGNFVHFANADPVGGITIDGEYQVQFIVDADMYIIRHQVPPTFTDTGGGSVDFEYEIQVGLEGNQTLFGYGTGAYGLGAYGVGSFLAGAGILGNLRTWSLDNFGEDLLASPNGRQLYHWDRDGGPLVRAVLVPEAPNTIERMLISPQARHVVAFGAGTGSASVPGDKDKLLIRWASSEDFSDWIISSVNTAGDLRLDVGSEIITAIESRGDILIFTDQSLHAMQFIGGDLVFSLRHLGQSVKIISANGAVDVNGIVYAMAEDDFIMYDGVLRVMDCDVRNQVFDDINLGQGRKVYSGVNKLFTEVWWVYSSEGSDANDRYVKYNYYDQVWDFGTIERSAWHDSSSFFNQKPYGTFDGKIFVHETGVDETDPEDNLTPMLSFIDSYDMDVDEGTYHVFVRKMIPDFKKLVGSVDLSLTAKSYPSSTGVEVVTKGPFTISPTTAFVNPRIKGRQISMRIESDALGDDWRMGTWRAQLRRKGRRGN